MTIRLDSDGRVPVRRICRRYSQSAGPGAAGGGNRQTRKRDPSGSSLRSFGRSATATKTIRDVAPRRRCGYRRN
jgi:hypothetical protein